jgi:hypothetical protein
MRADARARVRANGLLQEAVCDAPAGQQSKPAAAAFSTTLGAKPNSSLCVGFPGRREAEATAGPASARSRDGINKAVEMRLVMLRQIFVFLRRLALISTTGHRAGRGDHEQTNGPQKTRTSGLNLRTMFEANLNKALTHGSECQAANRN